MSSGGRGVLWTPCLESWVSVQACRFQSNHIKGIQVIFFDGGTKNKHRMGGLVD